MAFWDDVLKFFGSGSTPKPSSTTNRGGSVSSGSSARSRLSSQSPSQKTSRPSYIPASFTGGGGGGGRASMSFTPPATEVPWGQDPNEKPSQGIRANQKFWGDVGKNIGNFFGSQWDAAEERAKNAERGWAGVGSALAPVNDYLWKESGASAKRAENFWGSAGDFARSVGELPPFQQAWKDAEGRANNAANFWEGLGPTFARIGDANLRRTPAGRAAEEEEDRRAALGGGTATPEQIQERQWSYKNKRGVRELSNEEWATLTPEQQQQVTANFAIYQATQADKAAGDAAGTSTRAVLDEFGIEGPIDRFLDGSAIATIADIMGTSGSTKTIQTAQSLGQSQVFDNEAVVNLVQQGQSLIDALRGSGVVSDSTSSYLQGAQKLASEQIPADRLEALDRVLVDMADREYFQFTQTDPDANQSLRTNLAAATADIDPALVSQYFLEQLSFGGNDIFMTPEEFTQNWLEG